MTPQVLRGGDVCNATTGALWSSVVNYRCATNSSITSDTIVAATVNNSTCKATIAVETPRAW